MVTEIEKKLIHLNSLNTGIEIWLRSEYFWKNWLVISTRRTDQNVQKFTITISIKTWKDMF